MVAKDLVWAVVVQLAEQKEPANLNSGGVDVKLQIREANVISKIFWSNT